MRGKPVSIAALKTTHSEILTEIQQNMRELYKSIRDDATTLKKGSELANVAGKELKAVQLKIAEAIFEYGLAQVVTMNTPKLVSEA